MRLFIGLPVPIEITRSLVRSAQTLHLPEEPRWTAPEKAHLTLVFLGEVAEERLPSIERELTALNVTPLPLKVTSLGSFPRSGILYAEIDPTSALLRLQKQIVERMAHCGFVPETRPYRPHITLARLRSPLRLGKTQMPRIDPARHSFRVQEVNLYRSHLSPKGSSYEVLCSKRAGNSQTED
ncbi:MAG TPA: RNA 2',3'-cyclic phosphodiesterase [Edaphobacter sp.]